MTLRWMYDASTPPASPPRWYAAAGYIGGDTPHVWSPAEWEDQWAPARLPIWTRTNVADAAAEGEIDGAAIVEALAVLNAPRGITVAVDTETVIYRQYLPALDQFLKARGFGLLNYGSLSFVLQNPLTSAGRWAADWVGWAHLLDSEQLAGQHGIRAGQVASAQMLGKDFDAGWIEQSVPLWHRAFAG